MQRSCKELKRIARENLTNIYSLPMKAYLYVTIITMLVELPFSMMQTVEALSMQNIIIFVAQILISIAAIVLTCGEYRIHLQLAKGQKTGIKELFYPLTHQPDRYILGRLLYLGISLIGLIPLMIAAILLYTHGATMVLPAILLSVLSGILVLVIALHFGLVYLFMLDDENLTIVEAFRKCQETMKGNKRRYLYMLFSFIGMLLLVILSLGVAILWVQPYMNQTITLLYLDVTGQLDLVEVAKKQPQPQEEPVLNQYK